LHLAADLNLPQIIEILIDAGLNINAKDIVISIFDQ